MDKDLTTSENIKAIALKLFKEEGYDKISVNEICKACGITKTTFYYHFKSKDELLNHFYRTQYDNPKGLLEAITLQKSIDKLWFVLLQYIENVISNGYEISKQVIKSNLNENKGTFSGKGRFTKDICIKLIAEAQAAGEIQNYSDPEIIHSTIKDAMTGILLLWCIENGSFDMKSAFRERFITILGIR